MAVLEQSNCAGDLLPLAPLANEKRQAVRQAVFRDVVRTHGMYGCRP